MTHTQINFLKNVVSENKKIIAQNEAELKNPRIRKPQSRVQAIKAAKSNIRFALEKLLNEGEIVL